MSRLHKVLWCHCAVAVALFSAPELKAQVHYCDHGLSSVVMNLSSHFQLLWNHGTESNQTWQEVRTCMSCSTFFYFSADRKTKMTAPASDLLRHFQLLWNHSTEFDEAWQEKNSKSSTKFVLCADPKTKMATLAYDWLRHVWLLL